MTDKKDFNSFAVSYAAWSQETFGPDSQRGPIGPLNHLKKEVQNELLIDPHDREEYADAFMLILDAARRAGFDHHSLLEAAFEKLEINKTRKWQAPNPDGSIEHVR